MIHGSKYDVHVANITKKRVHKTIRKCTNSTDTRLLERMQMTKVSDTIDVTLDYILKHFCSSVCC